MTVGTTGAKIDDVTEPPLWMVHFRDTTPATGNSRKTQLSDNHATVVETPSCVTRLFFRGKCTVPHFLFDDFL
jgi:hypothetical protein